MKCGEAWAYRERAYTPGSPVTKAEILQLDRNRPGKVRVRLHGGEQRGFFAYSDHCSLYRPL